MLAVFDRSELGLFLAAADHHDAAHQALAVLLGRERAPGQPWSHPSRNPPVRSTWRSVRNPPPATPILRTTTIFDRRRQNLRHAAFVVVVFVAGG